MGSAVGMGASRLLPGGAYAGGGHVGGGPAVYPSGYAGGAHSAGYAGGGGGCGDCAAASCGPGAAACLAGCAACGCGGVGCGSCGTAGYTYAIVGQGNGDFIPTTVYRYVGAGAGSIAAVPIPGPGCSCWWSLCLLLPLLLLWPLLDQTTTTTSTTTRPPVTTPPPRPEPTPRPTPAPTEETPAPTTTTPPAPTPPPQGPQGECLIYGDPHVITFDGSRASFYSAGEYWAVKSDTVWMQGRYAPTVVTNGLSVMKEIAIGGPFLKSKDGRDNILRVSALSATWNGVPIIPGFPDRWDSQDPPVQVVTDSSGQILQNGRAGKDMHVVHVTLPLFITVQINRWNEPGEGDYINARIVMSKQPNQDGHCGNFNGNGADDTRPLIRSRIGTNGVDPAQLLYRTKTPVHAPNRPDLNDCPTAKSDHARTLCAEKSESGIPSNECMIDVCFGGDAFAEHDADM